MPFRRQLCLFLVLLGCLAGAFEAWAQDEVAPADSYQFSQPIPVVIRMANNGVLQSMLVGIDAEGLSVITPQGRPLKYAPKKVRSVRSVDGSFFYAPAKDDLLEVIKRLNALQPSNANQAGANGVPGQPAAGVVPGTVAGAHSQPMPTFPVAGASAAGTNSATAASAQMMAHAQAGATNPTYPATTTTYPSTTTSAMPSSSHSAAPYASTYTPPTSSMGAHSQTPNMHTPSTMAHSPAANTGMSPHVGMNPGMGMGPQTMGWQYECQKCHHTFTSSVEIKAGHRCVKCGVVWGQVKDEHGRVTSSSPAARIGGGVGAIVMVIGVIVAIVRKVQSA